MSRPAPLSAHELPASEQKLYEERDAALRRRRLAATRVRRRRLLAIDLGVAAALALFGLIVAPGLAILALFALIVLVACALWIVAERLRARRSPLLRRRRRRARGPSGRAR